MQAALRGNPEVKSFDIRTPTDNYDQARALLGQSETGRKQLETLGPDAFPESYFVTLKDPQKFDGVVSQVSGMDGVGNVNSLESCSGRCSPTSQDAVGLAGDRRCWSSPRSCRSPTRSA